jgi:hypothetical protein
MPIRTADGYWPPLYGRQFCRLFGWIGHSWRQTVAGYEDGQMVAGRQCRRCWKTEDCDCQRCELTDGPRSGE